MIVYQGMCSQPMRCCSCRISACGARETNASDVSRAFRCAGWATWSATNEQPTQARSGYDPPSRVRRDLRPVEGAVDDQLATALEQVGEAQASRRALEPVLLVDRHPRHPPALGRQRVAGAGELLLLDEELLAGGVPLLRRDDRWCLHSLILLDPVARGSRSIPGTVKHHTRRSTVTLIR